MGLIGTLTADSKYNSYRENIGNAYFKVESVNIDTQQEKARVQVRGWLSEYARHNQGIGIFKRVFYIDLEEFKEVLCVPEELTKAAYEYIAQLPEFKDAEPALEKYTGKIEITKKIVEEQEKELETLIRQLKA